MIEFEYQGKRCQRKYTKEEYELDKQMIVVIEKHERAYDEMNKVWSRYGHVGYRNLTPEAKFEYDYWESEWNDYCDRHKSLTAERRILILRCNTLAVESGDFWQDEERTEVPFEQVYKTRYDCVLAPL